MSRQLRRFYKRALKPRVLVAAIPPEGVQEFVEPSKKQFQVVIKKQHNVPMCRSRGLIALAARSCPLSPQVQGGPVRMCC